MSKNEPPLSPLLTDAMNGIGAVAMLLVGVLLLGDGLIGSELPFLIFGLLLVALGTFRIAYRVNKGKWFRFFNRGGRGRRLHTGQRYR